MNKQIDLLESIWAKSFNIAGPDSYNLMLFAMREKGAEHLSLTMVAALLSNIDYLPK